MFHFLGNFDSKLGPNWEEFCVQIQQIFGELWYIFDEFWIQIGHKLKGILSQAWVNFRVILSPNLNKFLENCKKNWEILSQNLDQIFKEFCLQIEIDLLERELCQMFDEF